MTGLSHQRWGAVRIITTALLSVAGFAATLAVPAVAVAAPAGVPATRRPGAVAVPPAAMPARYDSARDEQWHLRELDAEAAWQLSTGKGVIVAVIDSGVDASHIDLVGQVLPGIDFVSRSGDGRVDPVGHGTTVAALIAGRGDDDKGVVGLAPRAKILPIRVLDEKNTYRDPLVVASAVRWAVDHGARVVNLSLGGSEYSPALAAALDYAFVRNVVVVACTGNRTKSPADVWYPAREPGVLAVAGLERDTDELWSGSVTGKQTALAAPATALVGAKPDDGYWLVQGTSFAAPMVAATAALLRARWPDMSAADVVNRLISTARDLGPAGRDDSFGFGRIDPVAALTAHVGAVSSNPLDDGAAPGVAGFGRAPDLTGAGAPAAVQPNRLTGSAGLDAVTWAARPAGSPAERSPAAAWNEGALLLVVLAGVAVVVRRVGRGSVPRFGPARRHNGRRTGKAGYGNVEEAHRDVHPAQPHHRRGPRQEGLG